jgi:tetratricopeptide (TPR) repeat protein
LSASAPELHAAVGLAEIVVEGPGHAASIDASDPRLAQAGDALRALRRAITRSRGFALILCACDAPASRDELIHRLADSMPSATLHRIDLGDQDNDLLDTVAACCISATPGPAMITGAERMLDDPDLAPGFLQGLNLRRAEWPRQAPQPVVFWVPRRVLGQLTAGAPDFFDCRSDSIELPELTNLALRPFAEREWQWGVDPRFTAEERTERRKELKARIAAAAGSNDERVVRARLEWWDEVAELEELRGNLDEALRIRREEELPGYQRLGDARSMAVTQGRIADVLQNRSELDEALRIRRKEALPVFQRLGDVRSVAITQGQIADVLQHRGELDEALRIRREEQLPVFQRLGDVREATITRGRIADVLQARGDLDEALRIRREEELPAYQRLGDVRSVTVTQGQIADVLQARGQLDEALRIRRETQLPAFQRLGELRSAAVTQGKIADVLQARGELDEALLIRREEMLPVFQRLGDVREIALTQGKLADVLQARGELDEALRIRREEELPAYQRLGDRREVLVCCVNISRVLLERAADRDCAAANTLLCQALADARGLRIPEAEHIEQLLAEHGMSCDAADVATDAARV